AGDTRSFWASSRGASGQQLLRALGWGEPQAIWFFLCPFKAAILAIDAQAQRVLVAVCDLAGPEHATSTICKAQEHMCVVVDSAAGDGGGEVGEDMCGNAAGDEAGEMECVTAHVADRATGAGERWVGAPGGLLVAGDLQV